MEYRKMGRTGLKVSSFCLGTMTLGRQVDEKESIQIIHAAMDAGVNFIDTADMYVNGVTEEILGKAIGGQRDSLVIASKGGHIRKLDKKYGEQRDYGPIDLARPRPFHPWPAGEGVGHNDMGLSRKHIMQALEGSLGRLRKERYDTLAVPTFVPFSSARRFGSVISSIWPAGIASSPPTTCLLETSNMNCFHCALRKGWGYVYLAQWQPASCPVNTIRTQHPLKGPDSAWPIWAIATTSHTGLMQTFRLLKSWKKSPKIMERACRNSPWHGC